MGDPRSDESDPGSDVHRMPRWVKGMMLAAAVLAVSVIALLLLGGEHGPAMHGAPPADAGG